MPRSRSGGNWPLLVGLLGLAAVSALLAVAQGLLTNLVSALVDPQWVSGHRRLLIAGLGVLATASLLAAVVQGWLSYRASQPAPPALRPLTDHSGPHAEATGPGGTAIGTICGPVSFGGLPLAPSVPSEAPATEPSWSNLPPRNPEFTGRGQLLDQLREKLQAGPAAVVAAHGLGGVGKTQLALEYAHRHRDQGTYDLVLWVPAATPLAVAGGLLLLAPALGVTVEADQEATAAAVLAELGRRTAWLLVFDNAEDPASLRRYLPSGRGGDVLVTSRNPAWAGVARPVDVDVLPPSEAVELLTTSSGDDDQAAASRLAELLGWLPLALAQAAGYVQQTPGLGLAGYLDRYQQAHAELLARGKPVDYPDTVATTWQLNFDQLSRTTPAAVELLRLLAFVAPECPIHPYVLTDHPGLLPEELGKAARDPLALDAATSALYRYSLVSPAQGGLRVHRLVQTVTRAHLPEQAAEWATRAVLLLSTVLADVPQDMSGWPRAAQLLPHALAAVDHTCDDPQAYRAVDRLLTMVSAYLVMRAEHAAARQAQERALHLKEAMLGPDHTDLAVTIRTLSSFWRPDELPTARQYLERAVRIEEAADQPDLLQAADTHIDLAKVLADLDDEAAALKHVAHAREHLERALRTGEPDPSRPRDSTPASPVPWAGWARRPTPSSILTAPANTWSAPYGPANPTQSNWRNATKASVASWARWARGPAPASTLSTPWPL